MRKTERRPEMHWQIIGTDQWDAPKVCIVVTPSSEDCSFSNCNGGVIGVVDVDFVFVEDGDVIGICKFYCAEE